MNTSCKDIHLAPYGVSLGPAGLIRFQLQLKSCKIWISSCKATGHASPLQSQSTVKVNMHHHTNVQSLFPCSAVLLTFPEKTLGAQCRELTFRRTTAAHCSSSTQNRLNWLYTDRAWIKHWRSSCASLHMQVPPLDPARSIAALGQAD